jgi:hypothetical protein
MGRRRVDDKVKKAAAAAAAENITMAEVTWCGLRAGAYGEKGMRRQMEDETVTEPENQIYGMILNTIYIYEIISRNTGDME